MSDAPPSLVELLGPVRVTLAGAPQPFGTDRRYQVLAYLACRGDWVDREELVHLFWAESAPDTARDNFRHLLGRVRALDLAQGLEVNRERLRWPVPTDLASFTRAVEERRWDRALGFYRGPLLGGMDAAGTGEFAAWLERERGRLHGLWRGTLLGRAGELTGGGAHLEAADLLGPLLEEGDPDEEALHAQIGALLRAGGRERAQRAYEAFVARLRAEFGLEPTADLNDLGRTLGEATGAPISGSPSRARSGHGPTRSALPAPTTSFVGRDLELAEITQRLSSLDCRLLTLTGPGGIGKTRLALEAARTLASNFPDGTVFVALDALQDHALIPATLAGSLGLYLRGQDNGLKEVVRAIGDQTLLLVLDNFEHLLEGTHVVQELLERCPNLRLLVTSRERLGVPGEWLLPLRGLAYPEGGTFGPAHLGQFDAVGLFVERARRVRPDFTPTEQDLPHLLTLCRQVEGMPLGLELAAVWVRTLSLKEIVRELGEDLDFLGQQERGRPQRHRGLRAMFEHSWRLLTPREQVVFRELAVFRGGFRLEAAQEVAGASLPVLTALTDKSLLRRSLDGRYSLHVLLGQYAREKLAEHPGEEAGARERHGRHYLSLLAERGEEIRGPGGATALVILDEEFGNIRAAWTWAVKGGRAEELGRAALPGLRYLTNRARYREGFALYGEVAALGEGGPTGSRQSARGQAFIAQAWFALRLGRHDEARRLAGRGLALVPPGSLPALYAHNVLGFVAARTGYYPEAERHYRTVLAPVERDGNERGQAGILPNLAALEAAMGRLDEAERHIERALSLSRRLDFWPGTVDALGVQGTVALAAGRLEEARASLERGLGLARDLDIHEFVPGLLLGLAHVASEADLPGEARRLGEEGLAAAQASANLTEEIGLLALLGRVGAALGDGRAALAQLREALHLARVHGETPRLLEGLVYLAEVWLGQGRVREAASLLCLVRRHPAAVYQTRELADRLLGEVRARLSPGDLAQAEEEGTPERLDALVADALAGLGMALPGALPA